MRWSDEITLVSEAETERVNEFGFLQKGEETERTVFADKKSVGYSEFYRADMAGYNLLTKFIVHAVDYNDEKVVIYCGKRLSVTRVYELKGGECLELTVAETVKGKG